MEDGTRKEIWGLNYKGAGFQQEDTSEDGGWKHPSKLRSQGCLNCYRADGLPRDGRFHFALSIAATSTQWHRPKRQPVE